MYVLFVTRIVKVNTNSTKRYEPRTANHETIRVSGPFVAKMAQRALIAALESHTCLAAELWTEQRVREEYAKTSGRHFMEQWQAICQAMAMLDQMPALK